jgi:hypothetical protein
VIDLDEELTEYGERWRAAQPQVPRDLVPDFGAKRWQSSRMLVAATVVLLLAVGGVIFAATRYSSPARVDIPPQRDPTTSTLSTPTTTGAPTAVAPPSATPDGTAIDTASTGPAPFVVADGTVWVATPTDSRCRSGRLTGFDAITLKTRGSVEIALCPVGISSSSDGIWVLSQPFDGTPFHLTLVDPATLQVGLEASVPGRPMGGANPGVHLTATPGSAWVAQATNGQPELDRISLTGAVTPISLPTDAYRLAATPDTVWVAAFGGGELFRVDPATNEVDSIAIAPGGVGYTWSLTANHDAAWATVVYQDVGATSPSPHLVRVDAASSAVTAYPIPAMSIAAGTGQLWAQVYANGIANPNYQAQQYDVAQIDPTTGQVTGTITAPVPKTFGYPSGGPTIAIGSGYVWTDDANGRITRTVP